MPVNKEPDISVVICTYNRDKFIGEALNCLSKQTLHREQFEIIVVDNRSTDNTAAIVKKFISDHPDLQMRYKCTRNRILIGLYYSY
jgi:glycosyltransferase involved in cell wall biosynthesis